jgi:cobalt-precorrin 5A hydrolase
MEINGGRVAIGIGCRNECFAAEIIELIHVALEKSGVTISDVGIMATAWSKEGAEAIINAADALDLPLVVIPQAKCDEMINLAQTVSQKVVDLFAIPSVAEVAALAAAGKEPRLLCPRVTSKAASCAIAIGNLREIDSTGETAP